jgi:ribonuclease HI
VGIGAVIVSPEGERHEVSRAGAARACNNQAEAQALIAALVEALALGARDVVIHTDSDVVVQQVAGSARTSIARLAGLFAQARALMDRFERVELRLVPRHRNTDADALARAAVGLAPKLDPTAAERRRRRRRR